MKKTYNEILDSMKQKFFEISGKNVDSMGDVVLRMQAVASELYSLECFGDYILKQAFPQTATGEYLDMHAKLRDMTRKNGAKASVELTFSVQEPSNSEIVIPSGVICACKDRPYIQFVTKSEASILPNQKTCTVLAEAIKEGSEFNVEQGTITVMVNPPAGIYSVINNAPANGGFTYENDDIFRKRITDDIKVPAVGHNAKSLCNLINRIPDVVKSNVSFNGTTINACVQTKSDTIDEALEAKINDIMGAFILLGFSVNIFPAKPKRVQLTARCRLAYPYSIENVENEISSMLNSAVSMNTIGHGFDLFELSKDCLKIEGVDDVGIRANVQTGSFILLADDEYLAVEKIEVDEFE